GGWFGCRGWELRGSRGRRRGRGWRGGGRGGLDHHRDGEGLGGGPIRLLAQHQGDGAEDHDMAEQGGRHAVGRDGRGWGKGNGGKGLGWSAGHGAARVKQVW